MKIKSIFTPETIKDDAFVQAMWNGKIQDSKTLHSIIKNISLDTLDSLSNSSEQNLQTSFLLELAKHFKEVNYSDKNISIIIKETIEKGISPFEIAKLLANIDIPKDYTEFANSKYSAEYPWLLENDLFQALKYSEKTIEDAGRPFLPADYYIKKLNVFRSSDSIDKSFVQNLITLLHTDFYTEDEKSALIDSLKKNNLNALDISCNPITFEPNDSIIAKQLKTVRSYFSGQIIPIDIATSLINQLITKSNKAPTVFDKKLLEASIQSIINHHLSEKGIDIGNRVFFGNGHSHDLGYYQSSPNCIWIDNNLLELFLSSTKMQDKARLFRSMFHEMHHAIQHHNVDNNNIDYLTYNFIKEYVIEQYDDNFYADNYRSIYTESDARKEEILGSIEFLKSLNPAFVNVLQRQFLNDYINETNNHTIYGDSTKKINVGKNGTKIDVSDYVGYLIQSNPQILTDNPILSMEYNLDGSQKNIETLLQEFEQKKSEKTSNYSDIYSIYYGLVSKTLKNTNTADIQLQEKLSDFFKEQPQLVSLADMQTLYKKVTDSQKREVYSRLIAILKSPSQSITTNQKGVDSVDHNSR